MRVPAHCCVDPVREPPPEPVDVDDRVTQYRESVTLARLMWERNYELKLPRWLERLTMPTLLLWAPKTAPRLPPSLLSGLGTCLARELSRYSVVATTCSPRRRRRSSP